MSHSETTTTMSLKVYSNSGLARTAPRSGHLSLASVSDQPARHITRTRESASHEPFPAGPIVDFDRWDQKHREYHDSEVAKLIGPAGDNDPTRGSRLAASIASARRSGNIIALVGQASKKSVSGAASGLSGAASSAKAVSPAREIDPMALRFGFWLEEAYQENGFERDGSKMVPIYCEHLPLQEIVDQALIMLQERGWIVTGPSAFEYNNKRSGTVRMALRSF
jgi:hypothetical protein